MRLDKSTIRSSQARILRHKAGHPQSSGTSKGTGNRAVAATASPFATETAIEILKAGGNAIDAAVAAAWALAVCEPSGSGLGGQTVLLIRFSTGKTIVVDGHSYAPAMVSRKRVKRSQQKKGYRSCSVPSTPATLGYVQRRYGKLSLSQVMQPAIDLAKNGYPVSKLHRRQLVWCLTDLSASASTSRLFLRKGRPFAKGQIFQQKELATTLARIATYGTEDFYRGDIAHAIINDMREHGGLMTLEDLLQYTFPVEREPLKISYRDYEVFSIPPPGGGLQLLLALKVLEELAPNGFGTQGDDWYETIAKVIFAVFHERERFPIHPRDMSPLLSKWLLSEDRIRVVADSITNQYGRSFVDNDDEEPGETTHVCVADSEGNLVSLTQSIQSLFGAKVANSQLGFLYNNYLYTCPRYSHPYQLGSRCIPRSNSAPTFVFRKGQPSGKQDGSEESRQGDWFLALGAAGSRRIISSTLQVLSNVLDRGLSLDQAVAFPRIHAILSGKVAIEKRAASNSLTERLENGFKAIQVKARYSYYMGAVQAVQATKDGQLIGAADPRRDGTASVY